MADLVSLTAPNGSSVRVAAGRVDALLAVGYTQSEEPRKASAEKSTSSKSKK